jgi:hypothetical protein
MTSVATGENPLKWDVLVTKRQGVTRDLPPGKEQWMWVPTSATLIYGRRDAVLVDAFLTVEQAHALVFRFIKQYPLFLQAQRRLSSGERPVPH